MRVLQTHQLKILNRITVFLIEIVLFLQPFGRVLKWQLELSFSYLDANLLKSSETLTIISNSNENRLRENACLAFNFAGFV